MSNADMDFKASILADVPTIGDTQKTRGRFAHCTDLRFYNIHVILLQRTQVFCAHVKRAMDVFVFSASLVCTGPLPLYLQKQLSLANL